MEINHSKIKTAVLLFICVFLVLCLQTITFIFTNSPRQAYNGIIMAFQFVICLFMVKIDFKIGGILAESLIAMGILNLLFICTTKHTLKPLPGLLNTTIYGITLVLLIQQFKIRMREAETDLLTGVKNRRGLYKLWQKKLEKNKPFSIVYIHLENFQGAIGKYGEQYSTQILRQIAERISGVIHNRENIGLIEGHGFYAVIDHQDTDIQKTINDLYASITEKYSVNGIDWYLVVSIGISKFPDDSREFLNLFRYANIAMYEAQKIETNKICFFNKEIDNRLMRESEIENYIKNGLEKNLFYLVYQPQFKLTEKKLRGFESLLRLKLEDGTNISPAEFIPVAEKKDLILEIDDYVIKRVLSEFKETVTSVNKDLIISVNVSAKNISDAGFVKKIQALLSEYNFPAENLEIEITEYCLVNSMKTTIENIKKLRQLGIHVALDDFGTGYTSLSYLSKMPVNLLKIDKSLVDDIETNPKTQDFVNAVIAMGHLMNCQVISEGVESENQLSLLKDKNCDYIQGYVWGKPLAYNVALELVDSSIK